eukprot:15313901-Heterocapsa_arctica.AAC.1
MTVFAEVAGAKGPWPAMHLRVRPQQVHALDVDAKLLALRAVEGGVAESCGDLCSGWRRLVIDVAVVAIELHILARDVPNRI